MRFSPRLCGYAAAAQPSLAPRNSPSQAPRELFRLPPACSHRAPGGCLQVWERTSQDWGGFFFLSNQARQPVPEPNAPEELKKGKSQPIKLFVLVLHPFSIRISWEMCLDRGLHETYSHRGSRALRLSVLLGMEHS